MVEEIGYISWNTFTKVLNQNHVPYAIKLNWRGEPLLHKEIIKMVKYAKVKDVHEISLNTNGLLLTGELARGLKEVGLDWLIISCDGATKATYETIRQGGDFEKLVKNIIEINTVERPKIRIQICKQKANLHEIKRWRNFFRPYADKLRIGHLFDPQGKRGYKIPIPETCTSLWQRLTIDWKGNIYPCPLFPCGFRNLWRFVCKVIFWEK